MKSLYESECLLAGFQADNYKAGRGEILSATSRSIVSKHRRLSSKPQEEDNLPDCVIIKRTPARRIGDEKLREVRALRKCNHPNIVRLFYWKVDEHNEVYLYTESCEQTLHEFLNNNNNELTLATVRVFSRQLLEGCQHLHDMQIVHRNIRPENILMATKETAVLKLSGFGTACFVDVSDGIECQAISAYTCPEMFYGVFVGHRPKQSFATDIFSLGVVICEMMGKKCPFKVSRSEKTMLVENVLFDKDMTSSGDAAEIHSGLRQMLRFDPVKRPAARFLLPYFAKWDAVCLLDGFHPDDFEAFEKVDYGAYYVTFWQRKAAAPSTTSTTSSLPQKMALNKISVRKMSRAEKRELGMLKICDHPNVLKIFYSFIVTEMTGPDQLYWYTELCDYNIKAFQREYRDLDKEILQRLGNQLIEACIYIHGIGVVHRDIRSESVLVTKGAVPGAARLKLSYFGHPCFARFRTGSGPDYDPPEKFSSESTTANLFAGDVFSMGVVLHEMLTGKLPFTIKELMMESRTTRPEERICENVREIEFRWCLTAMLQANPEARPHARDLPIMWGNASCLPGAFNPNDYVKSATIGSGAQGLVRKYIRRSPSSVKYFPKVIAVKKVRIRKLIGQSLREYDILKRCYGHRNILHLYFADVVKTPDHDNLMLYTELCDMSLKTFLEDKRLTFPEVWRLCGQLNDGCIFLHRVMRVVHRDIKPANILVNGDDPSSVNIKLADFGLARFVPDAGSSSGHSLDISACGTLRYSSPEMHQALIAGRPLHSPSAASSSCSSSSFATDIFSLGLVIFEMVCAELPFKESDMLLSSSDAEGLNLVEERVYGKIGGQQPRMAAALKRMLQWDPTRRAAAIDLAEYFTREDEEIRAE